VMHMMFSAMGESLASLPRRYQTRSAISITVTA
jgi:hypothetical protein